MWHESPGTNGERFPGGQKSKGVNAACWELGSSVVCGARGAVNLRGKTFFLSRMPSEWLGLGGTAGGPLVQPWHILVILALKPCREQPRVLQASFLLLF